MAILVNIQQREQILKKLHDKLQSRNRDKEKGKNKHKKRKGGPSQKIDKSTRLAAAFHASDNEEHSISKNDDQSHWLSSPQKLDGDDSEIDDEFTDNSVSILSESSDAATDDGNSTICNEVNATGIINNENIVRLRDKPKNSTVTNVTANNTRPTNVAAPFGPIMVLANLLMPNTIQPPSSSTFGSQVLPYSRFQLCPPRPPPPPPPPPLPPLLPIPLLPLPLLPPPPPLPPPSLLLPPHLASPTSHVFSHFPSADDVILINSDDDNDDDGTWHNTDAPLFSQVDDSDNGDDFFESHHYPQ